MKQYLEKFPSYADIARGLGKKPETVRQWGFRELIPADDLRALESLARRLGVEGVDADEMLTERLRIREERRNARKQRRQQPAG